MQIVYSYFMLMMQTTITAISMGLAVSVTPPVTAGAIGPPIMIVCLLFGGYYINVDSLPEVKFNT